MAQVKSDQEGERAAAFSTGAESELSFELSLPGASLHRYNYIGYALVEIGHLSDRFRPREVKENLGQLGSRKNPSLRRP